MCWLFFFFFKQKTAYEMRISDWSSDVCSSDLVTAIGAEQAFNGLIAPATVAQTAPEKTGAPQQAPDIGALHRRVATGATFEQCADPSCATRNQPFIEIGRAHV